MSTAFARKLMVTVCVGSIVAGCASSATDNASRSINEANERGNAELAKSHFVAPDAPSGPIRERRGLFLAGPTRESAHGSELPIKWQDKSVSFVSAQSMTFREVADLITRQTGLPVVARENDFQSAKTQPQVGSGADLTAAGAGGPTLAQGPTPPGFDPQRALEAARAAEGGFAAQSLYAPGGAAAAPGKMSVNYTGKLAGFLDLVADNFGYGWQYDDNRIAFSRTMVSIFDVPALPVVMKLAFSLDSGAQAQASGGGGAGGGGGLRQTGGSHQKASTDAAFDLWTDINKTLHNIVGGSGTVDISGATGTVTVNAPAVVVRQVRDYVKRINRELSREIVLAVDVYSVRLNQGDNYNFDLNVAFNAAKVGAGYATPGGIAGGVAGTTVANVLSSATGSNGLGAAILDPHSKFDGSSALVKALSTQGDVSVVTSTSLTTLNGIPAPFQVVNTRGYVSQVSTTVGAGFSSAVQTSLTPSSVTTGFNLYVVPRVDRNGTVLLQYGVNISELIGAHDGFDSFSTGGQTVQLPNINARNFVQEASVPVNGTLVLTGFEQNKDNRNNSGLGQSFFPLLGGGLQAQHGREIVVISITPRVISFGQKAALE